MLYAAYGSNINLEQMAYRCPNSVIVGVGVINGWKLCFNIHADIRKTNNPFDSVPVLLWDIADEDWARLDKYEGFPKYYVKETVCVGWFNEEENFYSDKAIVYIMGEEFYDKYSFPKKDYFNIIIEGYYENNIDFKYLHEAISYTSEMMESEYFDSCGWV